MMKKITTTTIFRVARVVVELRFDCTYICQKILKRLYIYSSPNQIKYHYFSMNNPSKLENVEGFPNIFEAFPNI